MYAIGNATSNFTCDSPALKHITTLEQQYTSLRDPLLSYEDDIDFHDAIRALARVNPWTASPKITDSRTRSVKRKRLLSHIRVKFTQKI